MLRIVACRSHRNGLDRDIVSAVTCPSSGVPSLVAMDVSCPSVLSDVQAAPPAVHVPSWLNDLLVFVPAGLCREVVHACIMFGLQDDTQVLLPRYYPEFVLKQWQTRRQRLIESQIHHALAHVQHAWWNVADSAPACDNTLMWAQLQSWPIDLHLPACLYRVARTIIREIRMVTRLNQAVAALRRNRLFPLSHFQHVWPLAHRQILERWRARKLGLARAQYRQSWNGCYEWLYERLLDQLNQGWNLMITIARIGLPTASTQPIFGLSCWFRR